MLPVLYLELFADLCPKTAENFRQLCVGTEAPRFGPAFVAGDSPGDVCAEVGPEGRVAGPGTRSARARFAGGQKRPF